MVVWFLIFDVVHEVRHVSFADRKSPIFNAEGWVQWPKESLCGLLPDFQIGIEAGLEGGVKSVEDDAFEVALFYEV